MEKRLIEDHRSQQHPPVQIVSLPLGLRYTLDFSPLANSSEFRATLQTRAVRPFSFRVAAFGGSGDSFGFANFSGVSDDGRPHREIGVCHQDIRNVSLRERWPFSALAVPGRKRVVSALPDGEASEMRTESGREQRDERDQRRGGIGDGRGGEAGGWRIARSVAAAIGATTDATKLAEMQRERCHCATCTL